MCVLFEGTRQKNMLRFPLGFPFKPQEDYPQSKPGIYNCCFAQMGRHLQAKLHLPAPTKPAGHGRAWAHTLNPEAWWVDDLGTSFFLWQLLWRPTLFPKSFVFTIFELLPTPSYLQASESPASPVPPAPAQLGDCRCASTGLEPMAWPNATWSTALTLAVVIGSM